MDRGVEQAVGGAPVFACVVDLHQFQHPQHDPAPGSLIRNAGGDADGLDLQRAAHGQHPA
jgi:hypothetical protein